MRATRGGVGADLDGVLATDEKLFDRAIGAKAGKMFCNQESVVETTSADVFFDGGEGDENEFLAVIREFVGKNGV